MCFRSQCSLCHTARGWIGANAELHGTGHTLYSVQKGMKHKPACPGMVNVNIIFTSEKICSIRYIKISLRHTNQVMCIGNTWRVSHFTVREETGTSTHTRYITFSARPAIRKLDYHLYVNRIRNMCTSTQASRSHLVYNMPKEPYWRDLHASQKFTVCLSELLRPFSWTGLSYFCTQGKYAC